MNSTLNPSLTAAQSLKQLRGELMRDAHLAQLLDAVRRSGEVQLDGVWGSSVSLMIAALVDRVSPVVVVCAHSGMVDDLLDDFQLFSEAPAVTYPALEARPNRMLQDDNYGERLRTLKQLLHGESVGVILTSVQALLQAAPSRQHLAEKSRWLRVGERLDVEGLAGWLAENRYHATSAVELPGEFSVRGGIVDLYASDWEQPVRVELFDDQIESLRRIDLATQRSAESLTAVELTVLDASGAAGSACLTDYLPSHSAVVLIEPEEVQHQGMQFLERAEATESHLSLGTLFGNFQRFGRLAVAPLAAGRDDLMYRVPVESIERFSGEIGRVRGELDQVSTEHQVFLVAETDAEIKRLGEILGSTQTALQSRLHYVVGRLRAGFRLLPAHVLVVSGNELFHRAPLRRTTRRRASKAIESFLELRNGDLVVHLAHGIGRYRGLKLLDKDGHVEEHLEVEFHGGTKVFVPATKIELIQKYVGARKTNPRLATIGGKNWLRQKKAAEAAVADLASELLEVQAQRAARPGIRFAADTDWQKEFDSAFPYTETADQLLAVDAIKDDMEAPRPMDRLICGDVGFGKTELAMRAAFKAVDNGYQVAVLVPTTILAEQHYRTFVERMAEFPFSIAKLSRFCTAQEQRDTIRALRRRRGHRHRDPSPCLTRRRIRKPGIADHR